MADDREEKLRAVLFREENAARNWQDSALTSHRQDSLDYYERNPVGVLSAVDGQSKVVTSEYADTIEAIMPTMMRVFASGEDIAQFTPDYPGDEQAAEEATKYIPHLLMRELDGFIRLYWFTKDALMYRLAWCAVDVEEVEEVKRRSFRDLPADQFALLSQEATQKAQDKGAEVEVEAESDQDEGKQTKASVEYGEGMPNAHCGICKHYLGGACELVQGAIAPDMWCKLFEQRQLGDPPPMGQPPMFSGTVTVRRKVKKVRLDSVAPEDGLISPMARTIDEASFVGYRKRVTASDLRVLRVSQDDIDEMAPGEIYTAEQAQRQPDVVQAADERDNLDDSERKLWVVVAYVRFDWDGDGISEMRRVVYAHAGGMPQVFIENEEWTDGIAPIVSGSPLLMSHTIEGRSIFDMVKDIQEVSTAITRGMLTNMYLVNQPRPAVSDAVDIASLIDWTPGMPIRMRQGQKPTPDNLTWVETPPIMDKALAVLQWKDTVLQKRTGITPNNQGVPDEAMNPTATGAALITSAADQRIELIARTFAETSIKRLFRLLYRAVKRASDGPIKYWTGEPGADAANPANWTIVDPTQWPDDMTLKVDVGLGASNKQQQLQQIMMVGQGQQLLWAAQGGQEGPMLTVDHLANTFRKSVQIAGFTNTAQFVNGPQQIEQAKQQAAQQPPPPNPEMAKVQAQAQADAAKLQADTQANQQKLQSDAQMAQMKLAADIQLRRDSAAADMQIAREKAALDMQLAREKAALDAELERQQIEREAQLEALKISLMPKPGNTEIKEQTV